MVDPTGAVHTCIKCGQVKSLTEFYVRSDTGKIKNTCKGCCAEWNWEYRRSGPQVQGRYQKYDRPGGRRECRVCLQVKLLADFQPRQGRSSKRRNECRDCFLGIARDRYRAAPDKHRDVMRRSMYGLALGRYEQMHGEQNGLCAICGESETSPERYTGKPRRLFVDHHHDTGQVRGLLCMRCNMGIGQFRDDPDLLRKAIEYLSRHQVT